jgi:hypothetical protein
MRMSKREPLFPPASAAVANALYKAAGKGISHQSCFNEDDINEMNQKFNHAFVIT